MDNFCELTEALRRLASVSLDWDESKHPRGNQKNAGQFAKKGTATSSSTNGGSSNSSSGRYSNRNVTPEQDAAYADAVKRGDRKTALQMLRETAAKAMPNTVVVGEDGFPKVLWHGGGIHDYKLDRKTFTMTDLADKNKVMKNEFWLSSSRDEAASYNKHDDVVMPFFVMSKNPAVYDVHGNPFFAIYGDKNVEFDENGEQINRYTEELVQPHSQSNDGTDCVIVRNVTGVIGVPSDFYVVYSHGVDSFNRNVKSADITYGDDGKVIPLSERFNPSNPDIRY